jgi:hypothetical protein
VLLRFATSVGEGEKPTIRLQVEQAMLEYLSALRIGQEFIVKELTQRIMDVHEGILDFEFRCFAFSHRPQIIRNFAPEADEVLIPDPDRDRPIQAL